MALRGIQEYIARDVNNIARVENLAPCKRAISQLFINYLSSYSIEKIHILYYILMNYTAVNIPALKNYSQHCCSNNSKHVYTVLLRWKRAGIHLSHVLELQFMFE